MKLTLWTYEGPTHMGAMRVAASMEGVHYVLHAPQGDTYADLLFTMIERNDRRPPVTYTTFQARDLGGDTADLVLRTVKAAAERFQPELMLVGESCTAELIQDQPATLALGVGLPLPIVPLELPSYSRKENFGASETFYHLVRAVLKRSDAPARTVRPSVNLLGPTSLGFRARDNVVEVTRMLEKLGIAVNLAAPLGASPTDIARLPAAWANVCLYPEVADTTARWLEKEYQQPVIRTVPIGSIATAKFLAQVCEALGLPAPETRGESRLPWYSRSVDSTYLTGKRVFVFGDATHACAAARVARDELGFDVVGLGTYSREFARDVRALAAELRVTPLITDDYLEVEQAVTELAPELVLGTQMERHMAKRLGVPCALISAPFHVQDCPARYSPTMGWEGANVLFDSWVHPLMMGLEEHLLAMFREDFEFGNGAGPSHLHGGTAVAAPPAQADSPAPMADAQPEASEDLEADIALTWTDDAVTELKKIPFFVRGKARNNTERFAAEQGVAEITVETLYDAKAHFSR
jgi:light-independent protochlorophyllide reductase subunit B